MFYIRCIIALVLILVLLTGVNFGSDMLSDIYLQRKMEKSNQLVLLVEKPFITTDLTTPTTVLHRGQSFYVNYHLIRTQMCSFDFTTYINSQPDDPNHITYAYRSVNSWSLAGTYHFNELFDMPTNLPAGNYHILKRYVNHCGARDTYFTTAYDIDFTLVD